jgi:hypothetical protein
MRTVLYFECKWKHGITSKINCIYIELIQLILHTKSSAEKKEHIFWSYAETFCVIEVYEVEK